VFLYATLRGNRRFTYTHRLVDGCVAVAVTVAVLVVGISARLARERGSALAGSSHCCPAE
jgi:hypothetical protein